MERITRTHHPIFQSSHENPLQTPAALASPGPSQRPATAPTQQVMADSAAAGILPVSCLPAAWHPPLSNGTVRRCATSCATCTLGRSV